jgi:uroporphyrin-III C-methyltransferase
VGAGPGDPGLLTLRAAALLESADVVYYDRLVSASILERIPARVEKVYVGKEVGCPARADIEALLARSAREGKRVVRLKGGDPFVFGRGGEEMLELRRAGIEFEVVPGVSALSSVPGWAGIPVTARGVADEIVVRSGHAGAAGDDDEADEPVGSGAASAARARRGSGTTYIYFMAVRRLAHVVEELRREGLPSSTPVAVIQKGTLPEQKVLVSDLGSLLATAEREPPESPALVVAGEVVRFAVLDESQALPESRLLSERR